MAICKNFEVRYVDTEARVHRRIGVVFRFFADACLAADGVAAELGVDFTVWHEDFERPLYDSRATPPPPAVSA